MKLKISSLRMDGGTQPRARIDDEVVRDYANDMLAGGDFPEVVAFFDGTDYWLADGFHRVHAADQAGKSYVQVEVQQGTQRDAVLYACGTNSAHGMRRTPEDKRRAVSKLLRDEEWATWTDSVIAKKCGLLDSYWRGQVAEMRKHLASSGKIVTDRKVERGGTIYTQKTSNIGKSRAEKPDEDMRAVDAPAAPEMEPIPDEEEREEAQTPEILPGVEEAIEAIMETIKQQIDGLASPAAIRATIAAVLEKLNQWSKDLED